MKITRIINLKSVTAKEIQRSVNQNIDPVFKDYLDKGFIAYVTSVNPITKQATIEIDTSKDKKIPPEMINKMKEEYYNGCEEMLIQYIKQLYIDYDCSAETIINGLDEIITECEQEENDISCCITDAEGFVHDAIENMSA